MINGINKKNRTIAKGGETTLLWGHRAPLLMRSNNTKNYIEVLTSSHSSLECDMIGFTTI